MGDAIIILVTPPIHYIVFAIPHKKEIPSLKRTAVKAVFFTLKKRVAVVMCFQ